jgi:hypothetical protein
MKLNDLEKFVIREFVNSQNLDISDLESKLHATEIEGRDFSAVGFLTDLRPTLNIFLSGTSFTGGNVDVRINETIDTGYVLYIKNGYLEAIEGYTYGGDLWPSKIECFRLIAGK